MPRSSIRNGKPKVVKSKVGTGVSDEELATAVEGVLDLPAAERTVTVAVGAREPTLTTEQAKALGVKERLSTFTQNFPYAAYRVQNIGEAARRVNGTLLMPGETFSLNDTIKERTEENGYTEGFVVGEGGVFDEALGGGVSAAATTVWTGAFFAGMERVQTIAHSIYISRYQPGLEATVAWGIFDMKFRNDTPNAVFITAGTTNSSMTVSFWGTKEYDEIAAEFGERTNIVPFDEDLRRVRGLPGPERGRRLHDHRRPRLLQGRRGGPPRAHHHPLQARPGRDLRPQAGQEARQEPGQERDRRPGRRRRAAMPRTAAATRPPPSDDAGDAPAEDDVFSNE